MGTIQEQVPSPGPRHGDGQRVLPLSLQASWGPQPELKSRYQHGRHVDQSEGSQGLWSLLLGPCHLSKTPPSPSAKPGSSLPPPSASIQAVLTGGCGWGLPLNVTAAPLPAAPPPAASWQQEGCATSLLPWCLSRAWSPLTTGPQSSLQGCSAPRCPLAPSPLTQVLSIPDSGDWLGRWFM